MRRPRYIGAACVICFVVMGSSAAAQVPPPKPKPKPTAKSAAPHLPGMLLVEVDDRASVAIDGRVVGDVTVGQPRKIPVTLGRHVLRITSARTGTSWDQVVEVKDGAQEVVRVRVKEMVEQKVWLAEQRALGAGGTGAGDKTVLLVVDAPLRSLMREHAAAFAASRIRPGPGIAGIAANAEAGVAETHAALKLDAPRPGGEIEVAGTKMRNCAATVLLTVTKQGVPANYPIDGIGAGASDAAACNEAARRAVASALTTLVNVLRRDGR